MDKLSYQLEVFEGPLDLLLYLISKNKLNIYDIPLLELTRQYIAHIEQMKEQDFEVTSEFLDMAARLVYLKTVSLLPRHEEAVQLKEELTGELVEYKLCQEIAAKLTGMTDGFNAFIRKTAEIEFDKTYANIHPSERLVRAYFEAVGRGQRKLPPSDIPFRTIVAKKTVPVPSKIVFILRKLWKGGKHKMLSLFDNVTSRSEIVATFLALLELCKVKRVTVEGEGDNTAIVLIKERKNGDN